ncbi:PIG-L deacetylase family protein [Elioraea rosea]|uniref:PIG-L deacetylase family protein n=1 Tax=Elioraea rosea TaxID=2492390 RepID=UPI0013153BE6|nr:PIG-L family deacetylase [Elioraea rosea]
MAAATTAPFADLDDIIGPGGLVVLAPHPDDESLGCGALLRAAAFAGRRSVVVVVTDGRRSHPSSPSVGADALAQLRALEVRAALAALHPDIALIELGYRDCEAPDAPPAAAIAASVIAGAVDEFGATALVATWRGDPHKDHVATAELARRVVALRPGLRLWSYPIWGRFAPPEGAADAAAPTRIVRFDARRFCSAKAAAIACHRSQMTRMIHDDPDGFMMIGEMQTHFIDHPEVYLAD